MAVLEGPKNGVPLSLGHFSVERTGTETLFGKPLGHRHGFQACMAEDKATLRPFPEKNVHESFHFMPEGNEVRPVDDILVLFPVLHKGDGHRVSKVLFREFPDFPGHGGGKKPCPLPLGKGVENSFEFIPKPHVEHVISFIENYGMNAVRFESSPVHVVQGPSGGAHDDDRTVLERADLG